MKLKTTSEKAKKTAKAVESTSTAKKSTRKSRTPKIRKDFSSMVHYRAETGTVDLTQLTYGVINGHDVKSVSTPDGVLTLNDSWIELVLLMVSTVYENYKDTFKTTIANAGIVSETFNIDTTYGRYSFDKRFQYKVYKVYDTGLYIESTFTEENIFKALIGLVGLCGIKLNDFKMNIVSKEYIERKVDFDLLSSNEKIVTIDQLADALKDNWVLAEIEIMNERIAITDLSAILWIFCKWVYDNFGDAGVLKLPKHKNNGVAKSSDRDDVHYQQIGNTGLFVYTNRKTSDIVRFIKSSIEKLDIPSDTVKFKLKQLNDEVPKDPYLYEQYRMVRDHIKER